MNLDLRTYKLTRVKPPTESGDCTDCGALTDNEIADGVFVCDSCYEALVAALAGDDE